MKNLIVIILLAAVCVGLGVVLFTKTQRAEEQQQKNVDTILSHSNQWVKTSLELDEEREVNKALTADLQQSRTDFVELTNTYSDIASKLTKTEAELKDSQSALAQRDSKIASLETQNRELDERAIDLSASLTNLTIQIAETQRKLDASEGDKVFLEQELKRLMAEKAELERQFNDLAILRAQVSKLKEELSIARRLEWIRKGLFASGEQKGAQQLLTVKNSVKKAEEPAYDLNVEITADGSVKVIPGITNSPETNPAPATP